MDSIRNYDTLETENDTDTDCSASETRLQLLVNQVRSVYLLAVSKNNFHACRHCSDHVVVVQRRSRNVKQRKKVRKECDSVAFGGRRERAWLPVVRLTSHWHGLFSSFSLLKKTNTLHKTLFREWSTLHRIERDLDEIWLPCSPKSIEH